MANVNRGFCAPPLPFYGNKKFWAGELYDEAMLIPSGVTVWDVFGGSGVCARCIKDARPDLRVVWNDFDGFSDRVRHIAETEEIRRQLLRIVGGEGDMVGGGSRLRCPLSVEQAASVQELCSGALKKHGFLDGLSIRRWLSLGVVKESYNPDNPPANLYARVPRNPLRIADALRWLDGLETIRDDVQNLVIPAGDYLILDPPYVASVCDAYRGRDTLSVLKTVRDLMVGRPFILFGDASISFWYEVLTEKYSPRFFLKKDLVSGMQGNKRSEVMYSTW